MRVIGIGWQNDLCHVHSCIYVNAKFGKANFIDINHRVLVGYKVKHPVQINGKTITTGMVSYHKNRERKNVLFQVDKHCTTAPLPTSDDVTSFDTEVATGGGALAFSDYVLAADAFEDLLFIVMDSLSIFAIN